MCYKTDGNDNITVESLQVGFSQSTVAVEEDAGTVTLAVGLNQNASVIIPIIITYSTSEVAGKTNAASKFAHTIANCTGTHARTRTHTHTHTSNII